ncbi:MAG: Uma2 family endonuclease [Chloroflexi bacterium]|nr:Uma2 family endonuclease [Chloroflexota bacterium]
MYVGLSASESLLDEARANPALEIHGEPHDLRFDAEGNLRLVDSRLSAVRAHTIMETTMTEPARKHYTLAEYLDLEEASEVKHEYYDGQIWAMTGASINHNRIVGNLVTTLNNALQGSACEVFPSDMRVQTPSGLYTYPDVSVVCGGAVLGEARLDTLTNPTVLFEVLSDSTARNDRGRKFDLYRSIPTLQDIVFVDQYRVWLEHRRAASGDWIDRTLADLGASLELPSIGCSIGLADLYRRVSFGSHSD